MTGKIETQEALSSRLKLVVEGVSKTKGALEWFGKLDSFLLNIHESIPSKLQNIEFLNSLWDDNPVAATGMGTIKIAPAIKDVDFRGWFASEVVKPLPTSLIEIEVRLIEFYDELQSKMQQLCGRTPILKLNRVLCAIYPEHLSTIADVGKLRVLYREMGGTTSAHPITMHMKVRARINDILGPVDQTDKLDKARRICLAWMLYEQIANEDNDSHQLAQSSPLHSLIPQPAILRRKGLTSIKGTFQTLLGFLPELKDGVSKDEFSALIQQSNPELRPSSVGTTINVISREFDICKRQGDTYQLTARGLNLLDTQDPDELADHLVTKILGVDNILKTLEIEPQTKSNLCSLLKTVNPGWTSDYAPQSLLSWLMSLGVIELSESKRVQLTERGRRWSEMISWNPESLPPPAETIEEFKSELADEVSLPNLSLLISRIQTPNSGKLKLDNQLIGQLHCGLWSHPIRHFAVLTGISGSGKTQLALNYALALCDANSPDQEQVRVFPVQPGWYDPSPLLGYVNPIQDTSYRSTPFLDLLQRAADNPEKPYVAILDEMNLSHPEQYLAPILSAMETHGWIELHQLADSSTPIRQRIQYPANFAIIGTINMDETTHGLSDKVLDRAYTLEFWNIDVHEFPGWSTINLSTEIKESTKVLLDQLMKALAPVRLHFGWRTIDDVLNFLNFQLQQNPNDSHALDNVIYAKILPKLRGEGVRFGKVLQEVFEICKKFHLERCSAKVKSMQDDLEETGSARYWR
nr:hypothetical protein [uncultured Undibacterium sp.]